MQEVIEILKTRRDSVIARMVDLDADIKRSEEALASSLRTKADFGKLILELEQGIEKLQAAEPPIGLDETGMS